MEMSNSENGVVAVIPARWASSRFPGKPLHLIAGKPLVRRVWERVRLAESIQRVIIATDTEQVADAAVKFGAEVVMTSSNHESGTDRIAEVARKLEGVSHVINVQGDEPLVEPMLLDLLARTLTSDPSIQMITSAVPFEFGEDICNPHAVKVVLDCHGDALYFSRSPIPYLRDAAPETSARYLRHQGLYGYSLDFLFKFVSWPPSSLEKREQLEQLRALENGAKIRVITTRHSSLGVDTPEDAVKVEEIIAEMTS
jgi:3-deoxy-manno-octulosonate cytidylyltransferase (CMP-KDO synthetase)